VVNSEFAAANWFDGDAAKRRFAAANFPSGPPLGAPRSCNTKAGIPGLRCIWALRKRAMLNRRGAGPALPVGEVRAMPVPP
jgi:hypothetical protein